MPDRILLHHFDESPFSEKIRVIFGVKAIPWQSVRISRIMPRPDLMPLTGGYRRTPVMQIGADIYCDTQIIIRELERRFPAPTLIPDGNEGLVSALAMWTDRIFFQNTVNLVFGTLADRVSKEFVEDRERLRGGQFDIPAMKAAIPQMKDQFRAHVAWIETQLGDGRDWLLGAISLADVHAYMNVWYALANPIGAAALLAEFPRVEAWVDRIRAIGHGPRSEMTPAEALAVAREATPRSARGADAADPNGRKPGDKVTVTPDDYGRIAVSGEIVSLSAHHIAIRRYDDRAGETVVHFPRAGFVVAAI
jgi:glutathione S-transferase